MTDNVYDDCYTFTLKDTRSWWKDLTVDLGTFNPDYWSKERAGTLTQEERDTLKERIDTPKDQDVPYLDTYTTDS